MSETFHDIQKRDLAVVIEAHGEAITLVTAEGSIPSRAIMREVGDRPDFVRRDAYGNGRWFTARVHGDDVADPVAIKFIQDAIGSKFEIAGFKEVGRPRIGVLFAAIYDDRVRGL